ncbi:hypothetical protein [Sphaerotilus sulfidivorans]|jgi:hypothetical protein|nr:hypothetical protein CQA4T8M7_01900 [Sphaerotilus natans]
MHPELSRHVEHIEGLRDLHLNLLKNMLQADGGKMFALDLLAAAVVKRSLSLCAGFTSLVRSSNYISAAALLRLQLDSCLRFYAAFIVDKPHEFASDVLHGTPVRKLKDRSGKFMTDRHLVDELGKKYEWMPRVYDATSGFIHLSERHIFATWKSSSDKADISLVVGASDEHFVDELWIEMAGAFLASTDALFEYLKGWVFTKENPELVSQLAAKREA